jgi:hypothetical protein
MFYKLKKNFKQLGIILQPQALPHMGLMNYLPKQNMTESAKLPIGMYTLNSKHMAEVSN